MRKRSKLFVDGRLVLFPFLVGLCGILFVHSLLASFVVLLCAGALYLVFRAQFAYFPWLIDDFESEMALPYEMHDL